MPRIDATGPLSVFPQTLFFILRGPAPCQTLELRRLVTPAPEWGPALAEHRSPAQDSQDSAPPGGVPPDAGQEDASSTPAVAVSDTQELILDSAPMGLGDSYI